MLITVLVLDVLYPAIYPAISITTPTIAMIAVARPGSLPQGTVTTFVYVMVMGVVTVVVTVVVMVLIVVVLVISIDTGLR